MKKTMLEGVFSQEGKPLADEQLSQTAKVPYEAPVTMRTLVETEGSFCGSVIEPEEPNTQTGMTISEHGFASEKDPVTGKMPDWDLDLSGKEWD